MCGAATVHCDDDDDDDDVPLLLLPLLPCNDRLSMYDTTFITHVDDDDDDDDGEEEEAAACTAVMTGDFERLNFFAAMRHR